MQTIKCLYPFSCEVVNLYQPSALYIEHLTRPMLLRGQGDGQFWERLITPEHMRARWTLLQCQ